MKKLTSPALILAICLLVIFSLAITPVNAQRRREKFGEARQRAAEKHELRKEQLSDRISLIKDERKAALVEKLLVRIEKSNEKWVTHWNRTLERLSSILDKIEERANAADDAGTDVSVVLAAIADARIAITSAQTAVNTQAENSYSFEFIEEESVGQVVRATIANFKNDTKATMQTVKDARTAVVNAIRNLKGVSGQNRPSTATDSAETQNE